MTVRTTNLASPFTNLSKASRTLQLIRLFSSLFALLFIIFTLTIPLASNSVYIARIDCAHLDVSYGLYKSLRNSVSLTPTFLDDSNSYDFPVDSSLTNSEIAILTEYAESQVADAPQYITTSLWSWCYGNYNITRYTDKQGKVHSLRNNDVVVCQKMPSAYVFDYREELELLGLGSILAYAFQTRKYDDANYARLVKTRHREFRMVTPLLVFGAATQLAIIIFTLVLYANRGKERDLSSVPRFLLHIMSALTLASFLCISVSAGMITELLTSIKQEIEKTLSDFGISLHLGNVWYSLLWLGVSFSTLTMLSWVLPIWCANPPDDEYEYEESYNNDTFASFTSNRHTHSNGQRFSGARSTQAIDDPMTGIDGKHGISRNNSSRSRYHQSGKSRHDFEQDIVSSEDSDEDRIQVSRQSFDYKNDLYESQPKLEIDHFSNDFYEKDEHELRKLGKSLSRKSSVRHLYKKTKPKKRDLSYLPEEEDTIQLLYNEANLADEKYPTPRHYREETYDGYVNANNVSRENSQKNRSRSNSARKLSRSKSGTSVGRKYDEDIFAEGSSSNLRAASALDINLDQQNSKNTFLLLKKKNHQHRQSLNDSLLNDDEINLLDLNNFINTFK